MIFEYGDLKRVSKVASVRKSILTMLYGKYFAEAKIDLNKTVEKLGVNDVQPFLPIEKQATLYHLLGIDHHLTFIDRTGRPVPLVDGVVVQDMLA